MILDNIWPVRVLQSKGELRGSGGYGKNFMEKAYKEWGGMIMDDIADATKQIQDEYGLSRNAHNCWGRKFWWVRSSSNVI